MILTCEKCRTRYLVPDQAIGTEGRQVRCKACTHEWFQAAPALGSEHAESVPMPVPEEIESMPFGSAVPALAMEDEIQSSMAMKMRLSPRLKGYAAAVAAFLVVLVGIVAAPGPVVAAWPPTAALYDALGVGMPVPGEGLKIERMEAAAAPDEKGNMVLIVKGVLSNPTGHAIPVPSIGISWGDSAGGGWRIVLPRAMLSPRGTMDFQDSRQISAKNVGEIKASFLLPEK